MLTNFARWIASVIAVFIPIKKGTLLLLEYSYPSGSNTRILGESLLPYFDVHTADGVAFLDPVRSFGELLPKIRLYLHTAQFEVLVSTHGLKKIKKQQLMIELWHGIPLKAMGSMETTDADSAEKRFSMDYLITSSKLQSMQLDACLHIDFHRHRILGSPRNDWLYREPQDLIGRLHGRNDFDKAVLYMPTFRTGYLGRTEGNVGQDLFNFGSLGEEAAFLQWLEEQNILLLVKLHPMEEKALLEKVRRFRSDHILVLQSELLVQHDIDLYELLPETDMLITDYSSIYFDYLLLDRPIVFANADLETYRRTRGLLLEPYEHWTPGHKAQDYEGLREAIERSLTEDRFAEKRMEIRDLFHLHQDGRSSERITEFIRQNRKE
ncbi:CDP-glycerol glycerophosphotransferase family protein [Indiicoccus explosivorum]|uniref:CDP-glycerol glycerophosphotransferase family protein n=1 Tax=Indiicoccus explosivorum TaxID=1917864 RepID=UPI0013906269|nr:CDP-glycerol glycerophosphotransferase family protein [Indiicoccus explosivorum]